MKNLLMKKWISYGIFLLCIPAVIYLGFTVFSSKSYAFIMLAISFLSCIPFFISFERKSQKTVKLVIIAVLIALSVLSRIAFAAIPSFKPVTAMVIITAIYFGSEAGFMTGALTAVISNFYFGQGPWTPFQMLTWGLIGLVAGLLSSGLKKNRIFLCLYGALSGVVFSLFMDLWSVIWWEGAFNLSRYLATVSASLLVMFLYAASNVVFLLIAIKPIGMILERIKKKYGI